MVSAAVCAVIAIVVGVIAAIVGFTVGQNHRKKYAEAKIGSAEEEAKRIINSPKHRKLYGPVWACGGALLIALTWLCTILF